MTSPASASFSAGEQTAKPWARLPQESVDLCDAAGFCRRLADDRGIGLEGLMRREHVVIGGDDPEIGNMVARKRLLLGGGTDRKAMGKVGATEHAALGTL